jgi:hypothetical protein
MGFPESCQNRTLGVFAEAGLEDYGPQLIGQTVVGAIHICSWIIDKLTGRPTCFAN